MPGPQRAGWKPGQKGDGTRGRGFGFSKYKNLACYCAVAADVEIERATGRVKVTRVVSAVDAGQIVQVFDPLVHIPAQMDKGMTERIRSMDRRWGLFQRPAVMVGGELKIEALDLRFDPMRDLTPITRLGNFKFALATSNNVAAGTLRELVAHAKANPGKIGYGTPGAGTPAPDWPLKSSDSACASARRN